MPKGEKLNALVGEYVNLAYPLPGGDGVKCLNDQATYPGNQLESESGGDRCFGILANMELSWYVHMRQKEQILNWF